MYQYTWSPWRGRVFILNPQSGIPIYRQLLEQVRRMVASGQLQPGAELPSVRELALAHAVNPDDDLQGLQPARGRRVAGAESRQTDDRWRVRRARSAAPAKRAQQLEPLLDQMVLAARQLQLSEAELVKAVRRKWEETDE